MLEIVMGLCDWRVNLISNCRELVKRKIWKTVARY